MPALPEEAAALRDVQVRSFAASVKKYGKAPPGHDSVAWQVRTMRFCMYYKILVAEQIVGGLIIKKRSDTHCHIARIFIDEGFQNQGIGTKVFALMERKLPKTKKWTLDTPYLSLSNHLFYEKLGFVKIGETRPAEHIHHPDNSFHLLLYEKTAQDKVVNNDKSRNGQV